MMRAPARTPNQHAGVTALPHVGVNLNLQQLMILDMLLLHQVAPLVLQVHLQVDARLASGSTAARPKSNSCAQPRTVVRLL